MTTEASVPRTIGSTGRGGLRLLHKDALSLKVTAVDLRQSDPISARAEDVQSSLIPLNRGRHACESAPQPWWTTRHSAVFSSAAIAFCWGREEGVHGAINGRFVFPKSSDVGIIAPTPGLGSPPGG